MHFQKLSSVTLMPLVISIVLLVLSNCAFAIDGDSSDFDNSGSDDLVVFRPESGLWLSRSSESGTEAAIQWGLSGDVPLAGRYFEPTEASLGVYRPNNGVWYLARLTSSSSISNTQEVQWGGFAGDIPVPCNYFGSSRQDLGIFRAGEWFIRYAPGFSDGITRSWGAAGDIPIPREVDNDDTCDLMVYRDGVWSVLLSNTAFTSATTLRWGVGTDTPIAGDFDGDGMHDFSVVRESSTTLSWFIRLSNSQGLITRNLIWGEPGDIPLVADLDGDDKDELIAWRPSTGQWYALTSRSNYQDALIQQWGLTADLPIALSGGVKR